MGGFYYMIAYNDKGNVRRFSNERFERFNEAKRVAEEMVGVTHLTIWKYYHKTRDCKSYTFVNGKWCW